MFTARTQANNFKKWSPYLLLLPHPAIFAFILYSLPFVGFVIVSCLFILLSLIALPSMWTVFWYFMISCGGLMVYGSITIDSNWARQLYFFLVRQRGNSDTQTLTIIRFCDFTINIAIEFWEPESDSLCACSLEPMEHGRDQAYLVYDHKHRLIFDSTTFY